MKRNLVVTVCAVVEADDDRVLSSIVSQALVKTAQHEGLQYGLVETITRNENGGVSVVQGVIKVPHEVDVDGDRVSVMAQFVQRIELD